MKVLMSQSSQKEHATMFRKLHHEKGKILVLPNAWDVLSARIFESVGFLAVATTSGGISTSLGYPDGENIPRVDMLSAVKRIASAVSVPVSADIESGYGESVEEVAETAKKVLESGAIGLNIEDSKKNNSSGLADSTTQVARIRAIRETARQMDIPLVINARTDAYRLGTGGEEERVDEVIRRAKLYIDAGADCIFPFGVSSAGPISRIVSQLNFPINVVAGVAPPIAELQKLGVARVSLATGVPKAAYAVVKKIAMELRESGTYNALMTDALTYQELNNLAPFGKRKGHAI